MFLNGFLDMHVALILDGNGRWATNRGMPRILGHRAGVLRVEECVRIAPDIGITDLTLYAFSTENWRRPAREVNALFALLKFYFTRKAQELASEGVRVRFIGRREDLHRSVVLTMERVEKLTQNGKRLNLNIAVDYGGRDEILRVIRRAAEMVRDGALAAAEIDEAFVARNSDLAESGQPDLVIRTGGDKRISNFLLWHIAYSELEFVDALWPDFTAGALEGIVANFGNRERRFGRIAAV